MNRQVAFSLLLILNTCFIISLWHMSHNFMLRNLKPEKTKGLFKFDGDTAYRISEYGAILAFLLTDLLFVYNFLA